MRRENKYLCVHWTQPCVLLKTWWIHWVKARIHYRSLNLFFADHIKWKNADGAIPPHKRNFVASGTLHLASTSRLLLSSAEAKFVGAPEALGAFLEGIKNNNKSYEALVSWWLLRIYSSVDQKLFIRITCLIQNTNIEGEGKRRRRNSLKSWPPQTDISSEHNFILCGFNQPYKCP